MLKISWSVVVVALLCASPLGAAASDAAPGPTGPLKDVLYSGTLTLYFSNDLPPFFAETTSVKVQINVHDEVWFGTGTLRYEGKDIKPDMKFIRDGELEIRPIGRIIRCDGGRCVSVNENTLYRDRIRLSIRTPTGWYDLPEEINSGLWDGGLVFGLDESVANQNGTAIEASSGTGTVRWTLKLYLVGS